MQLHARQMSDTLSSWLHTKIPEKAISGHLKTSLNEKYQTALDAMSEAEKAISPKAIHHMRELGYQPTILLTPPRNQSWFA